MNKTDKPIVNIYGDNNNVEVQVILPETSSKIPVAVAITIITIVSVAILAISLCCPELLADFVRWIVSIAIHS